MFSPGVPNLFIALLIHPEGEVGQGRHDLDQAGASRRGGVVLDTKERFEAMNGGRIVEGYARRNR